MDTSTRTSTASTGPQHRAAPGTSLAAQLAHIALTYSVLGDVVTDLGDVPLGPSAGPVATFTLEHNGVQFTAQIRDGVLTVDVPDPDVAAHIASIAGLPKHAALSTRYLHLWRGRVADYPVVVVGRGPEASLLTPIVMRRLLADINAGQLVDVTA